MEFQDKVLQCADCDAEFIFTAGEQSFFRDKQFRNEPKRCKSCKIKKVSMLDASQGGGPRKTSRVEFSTDCSLCGKPTTVPFRPTQGRPILCRVCFSQSKSQASA